MGCLVFRSFSGESLGLHGVDDEGFGDVTHHLFGVLGICYGLSHRLLLINMVIMVSRCLKL